MRGIWVTRAGLPTPLCNVPVFTLDGRHVGTPDLIDPSSGLVGQYNGALHLTGARAAVDLATEAEYRDLGLEPVTMVAADWGTVDAFVRRLVAASRRAAGRTSPPLWTIDPPRWWTPTTTVAERRELEVWQRARYLRYRRAA